MRSRGLLRADLWGWLLLLYRDFPKDGLVSPPFWKVGPHGGPGGSDFTPSGCKDLGPGAPCFATRGRCPQDLEGVKGKDM